MGFLKPKKNREFTYNPRYYDDNGEGNPYKFEQRFDKYRKSTLDNKGVVTKFKTAWSELRESSDQRATRLTLLIVAILVLIFLFIIDFDLSIFYNS